MMALPPYRRIASREPWWSNAIFSLEVMSGIVLLAWGTYGAILGGVSYQEAYVVLTRYIRGEWWLVSAAMTGLAQVVFGILDYRRCRGIIAMLACLFWGMLTDAVFQAVPRSPSAAVFFGWSLANVPTLILLRPRRR